MLKPDVGDERQVKSSKQKHKLRRENELEEIRQILGVPWGRGFLNRILDHCHIFHSISGRDPMDMSRMSGGRDEGLWILEEIYQADPNGYMKLIQEKRKRDGS